MELLNYVIEEALVVIPVLLVIGKLLKETPKVSDWSIPYILLAIGISLTIGILGVSVESVIQGILVTGASVYTHQIIKQTKEQG